MKHKVGDIIKIRTRDSMEKEYGVDCYGDITHKNCCFFRKMKKYCGKYLIVFRINCGGYDVKKGGYIIKDRMIYEEEELKEGDIVYVGDISKSECFNDKFEVIYLQKIKDFYLCVNNGYKEKYKNGELFDVCLRKYAVKKPIEEKKERKIIMTDSEWEEFTKKNGIKK